MSYKSSCSCLKCISVRNASNRQPISSYVTKWISSCDQLKFKKQQFCPAFGVIRDWWEENRRYSLHGVRSCFIITWCQKLFYYYMVSKVVLLLHGVKSCFTVHSFRSCFSLSQDYQIYRLFCCQAKGRAWCS